MEDVSSYARIRRGVEDKRQVVKSEACKGKVLSNIGGIETKVLPSA